MKIKTVIICLLTCFLCISVAYAETIQEELQQRVSFEHDQLYIVKDDGTLFLNDSAKKKHPELVQWQDLQAISVAPGVVLGLKENGTVIATALWDDNTLDVSSWKDIIRIQANSWCNYGLTADGTLVYVGEIEQGESANFNADEWKHIQTITAYDYYLYGLTDENKIVSTTDEDFSEMENEKIKSIVSELNGLTILLEDGRVCWYDIHFGKGFMGFIHDKGAVVTGITVDRNNMVAQMLTDGTIVADRYTHYDGFQVEGAVAFSGGIVMDKEGNLFANRDYGSDEPLPKLNIMENFYN